jgi:hypothetical protein
MTSLDKGGNDWLSAQAGFGQNSVLGAAVQPQSIFDTVSFAWSSGTTVASGSTGACGFANPHVDLATVIASTSALAPFFVLQQQHSIWNANRAFAYPALNADNTNVVYSLGVGGGGTYADAAVGFVADNTYYRTGHSAASPPGNRWGDFVTVRRTTDPSLVDAFSAEGFSVPIWHAGGSQYDTHYVVFGRPRPAGG